MKKYSYFKELQPISKPKICTKVLKSSLTIQNVTVIEYTPRPFLERTGWLSAWYGVNGQACLPSGR